MDTKFQLFVGKTVASVEGCLTCAIFTFTDGTKLEVNSVVTFHGNEEYAAETALEVEVK